LNLLISVLRPNQLIDPNELQLIAFT